MTRTVDKVAKPGYLTRKQADKIIAVIKKDAAARWTYITPAGGKTCVIGGLAVAARAKSLLPKAGAGIDNSILAPLANRLSAAYGLTRQQLRDLQSTNDAFITQRMRRKFLIDLVNSWVAE